MYIYANRACNRSADSGSHGYGSCVGVRGFAGYVYGFGSNFIHLAARQLPRKYINCNTTFKQHLHSYRCERRLQQHSHSGCNSSTHAHSYGHRFVVVCLSGRNSNTYCIGCKLIYLDAGQPEWKQYIGNTFGHYHLYGNRC